MTSSVRAKVEKGVWRMPRLSQAMKDKGVWRMPRLSQAMKDVISCDKLGVGANDR